MIKSCDIKDLVILNLDVLEIFLFCGTLNRYFK